MCIFIIVVHHKFVCILLSLQFQFQPLHSMLQNEEEDQEEPNNPLFLINQVSNEHPNSNAYNSKRTDRKSQSAPVPLKQNKQNKTKKPSKVSDMKWFSSTSFTRSVSLLFL